MQILLNGQPEQLEEKMSLALLLENRSCELNKIVVVYNQRVVKQEEWPQILLVESDVIELLKFVGGG